MPESIASILNGRLSTKHSAASNLQNSPTSTNIEQERQPNISEVKRLSKMHRIKWESLDLNPLILNLKSIPNYSLMWLLKNAVKTE